MKKNSFIKSLRMVTRPQGFTLVELMLAMVISFFIVAAIFSAYISQQRIYVAQDQVAELQQNIRAGNSFLISELRMAGFDNDNSTIDSTCNFGGNGSGVSPGVLAVDNDVRLDISTDINGNGDCSDSDENLSFYLYTTSDGVQALGRRDNTDNTPMVQAIARHIEEIEFRYLDVAGDETTDEEEVRSLQISLLARARHPDRNFTHSQEYCPGSNPLDNDGKCVDGAGTGWGPYNDNFRRRLLITTVNCRNMGL